MPLAPRSIASSCQARETALNITGFEPRLRGSKSGRILSSEMISLAKDDTTFVSFKPTGGRAWRVVFDSVDIRTPLSIDWKDLSWKVRRFEVLLDSATGTLLRIESLPMEGAESKKDSVGSERLERYMRTPGEIYWGPVTSDSIVPFIVALNGAVGCAPKGATEIAAILVTYSSRTRDSMAVWVVNTFGSTAGQSPIGDPGAPPCCLWNRCIVNARTGWMETWDTRE